MTNEEISRSLWLATVETKLPFVRDAVGVVIEAIWASTRPETVKWVTLLLRDMAFRADHNGEYDVAVILRRAAEALEDQL